MIITNDCIERVKSIVGKSPKVTNNKTTVANGLAYGSKYLILDNNWYEMTATDVNIFTNMGVILPVGNKDKDYFTYVPINVFATLCKSYINKSTTIKNKTTDTTPLTRTKDTTPARLRTTIKAIARKR